MASRIQAGWHSGWGQTSGLGGQSSFTFGNFNTANGNINGNGAILMFCIGTRPSAGTTPITVTSIDTPDGPTLPFVRLAGLSMSSGGRLEMWQAFNAPGADIGVVTVTLDTAVGAMGWILVEFESPDVDYTAANYTTGFRQLILAPTWGGVSAINLASSGWAPIQNPPTTENIGTLATYNGNLGMMAQYQTGTQFMDPSGDFPSGGFPGGTIISDGAGPGAGTLMKHNMFGTASSPILDWNHGFGGTPTGLTGFAVEVQPPPVPSAGGGLLSKSRRSEYQNMPYEVSSSMLRRR